MLELRDTTDLTAAELAADLDSRELKDQHWLGLWEFGQMAASGPRWLRNPDVYRSFNNRPIYNYIHDDLNGEGQVIYIVDSVIDPDHPVRTMASP